MKKKNYFNFWNLKQVASYHSQQARSDHSPGGEWLDALWLLKIKIQFVNSEKEGVTFLSKKTIEVAKISKCSKIEKISKV